jgi:uncharacterized protein YciI
MAMFLVELHRSGPRWDSLVPLEQQSDFAAHAAFMDGLVEEGFIVLGGPLADEFRVVEVIDAESVEAVRATLTGDPWNETHLRIASITPWTIRLDGRGRHLP